MLNSSNNTISNNTCSGSAYGLYLGGSNNNIISNNSCGGKSYGLFSAYGNNNSLNGNKGTLIETTGNPPTPNGYYDTLPVFIISAVLFITITAYLLLGRKKKAP